MRFSLLLVKTLFGIVMVLSLSSAVLAQDPEMVRHFDYPELYQPPRPN